ncbi:hypothetical protein IAU60_001836 [Kwoniella sp. DSM 27419]
MPLLSPMQEDNDTYIQTRSHEASTSRRTSNNLAFPLQRASGEAYTSSLSPTSPITYNSQSSRDRSPSPSRLRTDYWKLINGNPGRQRSTTGRSAVVRHLRPLLSVRVLSPLALWILAIWLVHTYLLPLPIPSLSSSANVKSAADHHLSTAFPQPPLRTGDDLLDSIDSRWRPFQPLKPPDVPFPRLRPTRFLPPKCLEQWLAEGETLCGRGEMGEEEKLDITWLWVNGSDHRWRQSMIHWRTKEGVYSPEHHFREQNELVHSMRSVLDALPGHLRTFHLILADYPFDYPNDVPLIPPSILPILEQNVKMNGHRRHARDLLSPAQEHGNTNMTERLDPFISPELASHLASTWRIAQTPTWLDFSQRDKSSPSHPFHPFSANQLPDGQAKLHKAEVEYPILRYAGHSEIFHLPSMDRDGHTEELGERQWKEAEWRKNALPSFNSIYPADEQADVTLSMNDDFFLLRPHAVSDFHSPLYGSVIRFDHGYYSQVRPLLDKNRFNDAGEIGGLYHANYLLSQRFPRRLRPYFAHVPKVVTRGLHHEASLMFKEALAMSSQRRFREMMLGEGDVQMQWLLTSLRVERWREALIWTYVVANLGTLAPSSDQWGHEARNELKDMFGMSEDDQDVVKIEVQRGERWTLEPGRMGKVLEQAGWEAPKATDFLFYLDRCFGSFWTREETVSSADMFKRLTFQYPECGDCLIIALVTASGPLGLSAFFPAKGITFDTPPLSAGKAYPTYIPPPHLPLTSTWHGADFSLESVMTTTALPEESVDLREYCMKLLSRYQYLSAKSTSHFHMLKSAEHAHRVFKMIQDNPRVSILGLNDDIEEDYDEVKGIMDEWFEQRWPKKAVWERGWNPVKDRVMI